MKKKKGFVFIETIVVIAILLTSLLLLYSSYISLSNNEKRRLMYDDVSYLYRTYFVKKYFTSQRLDRILSTLKRDNVSTNANFLTSFGCSNLDAFENYAKEGSFCEMLSQELHIAHIYLTYYDLSVLQDCTDNTTGLCTTFARVNQDLGAYLRTLGGKGVPGYRIIIEYQEDGKGHFCTDDEHCLHYFASLQIGE